MDDEHERLLLERARGSAKSTRIERVEAWFVGVLLAALTVLFLADLARWIIGAAN